jgi:hypothetical protein
MLGKVALTLVIGGIGIHYVGQEANAEEQMPGKCDEESTEVNGAETTMHWFSETGIWYTCGTNSCHPEPAEKHCHKHDHMAMP